MLEKRIIELLTRKMAGEATREDYQKGRHETIQQALSALQLIKPFNFKINEHEVSIY